MQSDWLSVGGYEGMYEVCVDGRVRSVDRVVKGPRGFPKRLKGKAISYGKTISGYPFVILYTDGIGKNHLVHRVVAETFLPKPEGRKEVNHKDCNKTNNHKNNLEWVSRSENSIHATVNGLLPKLLTKEAVVKIRQRRAEGAKYDDLVQEFGATRTTIHKAVYKKNWTKYV
jgi:hypothetical protein